MRLLHRQLPASSPLSLRACRVAAMQALGLGDDLRPQLAALLARDFAAERLILTESGTQALELALRVACLQLRDAVVALPAFSCFDVATAAVGADARLLLYDLDPTTLAPDLDSLDRVLALGAHVVVVAPLYGIPVDWDSIESCVQRHGAVAIEDAAQGHGASWRGRPLGSLGRMSVLSFGRAKGWTGGTGGALLLRGAAFGEPPPLPQARRAAELGAVAGALGQWALGRPALYALPAALPWLELGETKYRTPKPPYAITSAATALLMETYEAAGQEAQTRRANADFFLERLPVGRPLLPCRASVMAKPGYLRFPIRLARGICSLAEPTGAVRLGVAPSYPACLGELGAVRVRMISVGGRWPGAAALVRELVTLPTHSQLRASERDQVLRLLNS